MDQGAVVAGAPPASIPDTEHRPAGQPARGRFSQSEASSTSGPLIRAVVPLLGWHRPACCSSRAEQRHTARAVPGRSGPSRTACRVLCSAALTSHGSGRGTPFLQLISHRLAAPFNPVNTGEGPPNAGETDTLWFRRSVRWPVALPRCSGPPRTGWIRYARCTRLDDGRLPGLVFWRARTPADQAVAGFAATMGRVPVMTSQVITGAWHRVRC
jgi:hypothetical protein